MQLFIYALLAAFVSFLSSVAGVPITLYARDVFVPPILGPHNGTVWTTGATEIVTWDTSDRPKQITNTKGRIVLVKNGLLDYDHPLAAGFDILLGKYNIIVPNVEPGHEYQIVLFGDSGNASDKFTIVAPSDSDFDSDS